MVRQLVTNSLIPSFIPIGPDVKSVRRVPVVTFGIIGACVLVLLLSLLAEQPTAAQTVVIDAALQEVIDYWGAHPEATGPPWAWGIVDRLSSAQRSRLGELSDASEAEPTAADDIVQGAFEKLWLKLANTLPEDRWVIWGFDSEEPSAVAAITHMFAHADWGHLFWNMVFLFMCAVLLEDVWGRGLFLGFYVLSGLVALMPDLLIFSDRGAYTLGASGAVSAVMGAFAVRFWNVRMRLLLHVGMLAKPVLVSSWLILLFWFVRDIASIPGQIAGGSVDHIAHVVGFTFGASFAFAMRHFKVEERQLAALVEAKSNTVLIDNPHIERAIADHVGGLDRVARRRLVEAFHRDPDNVDTALALWNLSVDQGTPADGAAAMTHAIGVELKHGDLVNAVAHWREFVSHVPEATMDAPSLTRIARGLADRGLRAEAVETLRRALYTPTDRTTCAALLTIGVLSAELDDALTATAVAAILHRPDATPDDRARAEALLQRGDGVVAVGTA